MPGGRARGVKGVVRCSRQSVSLEPPATSSQISSALVAGGAESCPESFSGGDKDDNLSKP